MRERVVSGAPELLIFDCDGVLVDSEVLAARGYAEVLAEIGVEVPSDLWRQCVGLKQAEIFGLIEAATHRTVEPETREKLWPHTRKLFEAELKPTAGLREFLDASHVRRCVASSSSPERIGVSLQLTGLASYFDDVFSTQYVARGKPAPDIFLYACEKMGVSPQRALVIEDSAPGVQGARAAGARVVGYLGGAHIGEGHAERLLAAGAEFVAVDWAQIREYLARTHNESL
jgi:HAD superfamily hydrolase (TIGR01509 family)